MKLQKALAVVGAGVVLFAASDAVTYAATGSSLIMGRINQATSATTIQNTSTGSALRLITASTSTPPMVVNGKGKVVNLYADRAATADNAAKLGGQTVTQVRTGINAATVGGKTVGQIVSGVPRPAGVVWVAESGGQFTSVSAALASITDNSATNRYVIKVAPGIYTGVKSVAMKNFVDVEGSGQGVTTITCACGSDSDPGLDDSSSVFHVTGPNVHVGIRDLTIANTGSSLTFATGIITRNTAPGDIAVDDLTITATGASARMGIFNDSSSPTMTSVTATGTGGINSYSVSNSLASAPTIAFVTLIPAGTTASFGVLNRFSSLTMTNVTATATGGTDNYGVYNWSSSSTMANVTATATGGTNTYGILNDKSSPTMAGGSATGSGGAAINTGIWNIGGAPSYDSLTATGSGAPKAAAW